MTYSIEDIHAAVRTAVHDLAKGYGMTLEAERELLDTLWATVEQELTSGKVSEEAGSH